VRPILAVGGSIMASIALMGQCLSNRIMLKKLKKNRMPLTLTISESKMRQNRFADAIEVIQTSPAQSAQSAKRQSRLVHAISKKCIYDPFASRTWGGRIHVLA
jgi:hypothetical protein